MVLVDELSVPCLQIKDSRLAQDKEPLAFSRCFHSSPRPSDEEWVVFEAAVNPGMRTHTHTHTRHVARRLICTLFSVMLISFKGRL